MQLPAIRVFDQLYPENLLPHHPDLIAAVLLLYALLQLPTIRVFDDHYPENLLPHHPDLVAAVLLLYALFWLPRIAECDHHGLRGSPLVLLLDISLQD